MLFFLVVWALICFTHAHPRPHRNQMLEQHTEGSYPSYKEAFFTQRVDHERSPYVSATFNQRYLYTDEFWTGKGALPNDCRGPILFYTGNEAAITAFWSGNGFMLQELAPAWSALVVFGEQRYYGESLPFGNESFSRENVQYLTTGQVLSDYVSLIAHVKATFSGAKNCPVVAFGGSYGGTLTAYLRLKYPWVVVGGLASSAEFPYYATNLSSVGLNEYTWIDIVNHVYSSALPASSPDCLSLLVTAVQALSALASTSSGQAQISKALLFCEPLTNRQDFVNFVTETLESLPQENYPYPVGSAPGWPVHETCRLFAKVDVADTQQLLEACNTLFTWYWGPPDPCWEFSWAQGNTPGDGPGTGGWGYQSCTETLHQFSARGWRDWRFNISWADQTCENIWGARPDVSWLEQNYGNLEGLYENSNLILSGGLLDPWSAYYDRIIDVSRLPSSVSLLTLPQGAHHLDLRGPNPADPPDVSATRKAEAKIIWSWIKAYSQKNKQGKSGEKTDTIDGMDSDGAAKRRRDGKGDLHIYFPQRLPKISLR
eukprot:gb/GEZN01005777.1/.p1 GENE.gb/GEZN01005777.1/~~gb/GEZN01005777.1/.p1  ORF type:complete len:564 (-),score=50.62 gb/GEZN01005777.1/:63-1691(-)